MSEHPATLQDPEEAGHLNPLWLRELWIQGRSTRLPLALAALTVVVGLLIGSVGALASLRQEPARVGGLLYHVFFATAFAWVTWVGTGVAATFVSHEKTSTAWDVLLASGVSARTVARGGFASSLTWVLLCLAMISPVASFSFLFGGVSPAEIFWGFVATGVAACVAVGFGVAVGSASANPNTALLIAVPLGALGSMLFYALGFLSSFFVEMLWPQVLGGNALWWPTAMAHAKVDTRYWLLLVGAPLVLVWLTLSFLQAVTVANLSEPGSDRWRRLRYWFIVSGLLLFTLAASVSLWLPLHENVGLAASLTLLAVFLLFGMYTLAGEAIEPSARVLAQWDKNGAGAWHRFCGPGITRAMLTLCLLAAVGVGMQWLSAVAMQLRADGAESDLLLLSVCDGYVLGFVCFLAGFVANTRVRSRSGAAPRLLLTFVLLAVGIGPWILASAFGFVDSFSSQNTLLVAVPSPFFIVALAFTSPERGGLPGGLLLGGLLASISWLCLGLTLLYLAQRHIAKESST